MLSVASTHSTELPDTDGINLTDAQKSIAKTNDLIRVLKIQSIFTKITKIANRYLSVKIQNSYLDDGKCCSDK